MSVDESEFERTPPHNIGSEFAVLGACLLSTRAVAASQLTGQEFYRPGHELIFAAMLRLVARGAPTDAAAVLAELGEAASKVGGAPYLHTLMSNTPTAVNVAYHAKILTTLWLRRRVIEEAVRTIERAHGEEDPELLVEDVTSAWSKLRHGRDDDDLASLMTLGEFCDQPIPPRRWVCGDLIAAGERLVVTGVEGLGKTVLSRQLATAAAAGIHPFTLAPCTPVRVLALDLENPQDLMIESWSQLRTAAARRGRPVVDGRLMIDRRPEGIDLASVSDQRWVSRRVEVVRPDLLVVGPVYKMYIGGSNDREEDRARQVTAFLDQLRAEVGCALVLEHHSPHSPPGVKHRPIRPIGSSLWMRWPEFGFGIRLADVEQSDARRSVDWVRWRGARAARPWPERMETGPEGWPWVEAPPDVWTGKRS